jgi:hypothetical protein
LSRGSSPCGYPHEPLVSYQINRQLSGWILPPLMIRAFGAHCQDPTKCRANKEPRLRTSPPRLELTALILSTHRHAPSQTARERPGASSAPRVRPGHLAPLPKLGKSMPAKRRARSRSLLLKNARKPAGSIKDRARVDCSEANDKATETRASL